MDHVWTLLWWLLSTVWGVFLWLAISIITYLLAPVFFIAGWLMFLGVCYYLWLIWKHRGVGKATREYYAFMRALLQYLWSFARRSYRFLQGVHSMRESEAQGERIVEVVRPASRARRWLRTGIGICIGYTIGSYFPTPGLLGAIASFVWDTAARFWG